MLRDMRQPVVTQASSSLEPPAAATTIAVLLGASEYPQKPAWSNPVLGTSARAFRDYLLSPEGFALAPGQILDLFDADAGPADQLFQIKEFLKATSAQVRDLVVYYVGHGGFDNDDYYLGVRATRRDHEFITTIDSGKLARIIRQGFGHRRIYVILDSCFAASAARDWQGDEIEAAVRKLSQPLPRQGTAFLAAASKHDVTRAPRNQRYTVFTGAILDALTLGVDRLQPRISVYELYEQIRDRLQHRDSDDEARPELHVPSQHDGDVSQLQLFPNSAYLRIVEARRGLAHASAAASPKAVVRPPEDRAARSDISNEPGETTAEVARGEAEPAADDRSMEDHDAGDAVSAPPAMTGTGGAHARLRSRRRLVRAGLVAIAVSMVVLFASGLIVSGGRHGVRQEVDRSAVRAAKQQLVDDGSAVSPSLPTAPLAEAPVKPVADAGVPSASQQVDPTRRPAQVAPPPRASPAGAEKAIAPPAAIKKPLPPDPHSAVAPKTKAVAPAAASAAQGMGKLFAKSKSGSHLSVMVDGNRIGQTQMLYKPIIAGDHVIELVDDTTGKVVVRREVTVVEGKSITVSGP
jgi:hypothetical protein